MWLGQNKIKKRKGKKKKKEMGMHRMGLKDHCIGTKNWIKISKLLSQHYWYKLLNQTQVLKYTREGKMYTSGREMKTQCKKAMSKNMHDLLIPTLAQKGDV